MLSAFLSLAALLPPRQAEVFGGTQMFRSDVPSPSAIVAPPPDVPMPLTASWTASKYATGYTLTYWINGVTNQIDTDQTNVSFTVPNCDGQNRLFAIVTATNYYGETDSLNVAHYPPYDPDRFMVGVLGMSSFTLESSTDGKKWAVFTNATTPVTLMTTGSARMFRAKGATNEVKEMARWNPLNN